MAIIIEHDKRRKEILDKALNVFMDDGFENATFQKIADRCGITRTILYLYFKNKREIFLYSIKQLLTNAEDKINLISADDQLNTIEKITKVFSDIFTLMELNRQLLCVVLDYLLHLSKSGVDAGLRIRRRTVRFRHILSSILIEGVKSGEIKKTKIKIANEYLFSFINAAVYQLVVMRNDNIDELKDSAFFAVKLLAS